MKNKEIFSNRETRYKAFHRFCAKKGDCEKCEMHADAEARGSLDDCMKEWLESGYQIEPVANESKYKTPAERLEAWRKACKGGNRENCKACKYDSGDGLGYHSPHECFARWLSDCCEESADSKVTANELFGLLTRVDGFLYTVKRESLNAESDVRLKKEVSALSDAVLDMRMRLVKRIANWNRDLLDSKDTDKDKGESNRDATPDLRKELMEYEKSVGVDLGIDWTTGIDGIMDSASTGVIRMFLLWYFSGKQHVHSIIGTERT